MFLFLNLYYDIMEKIVFMLLTIFTVQVLGTERKGNYQYDNLSEGQNVVVSFNNTGSFRYDTVVDDSLNSSTIDHFDHKYHAKNDVTYGCFGWRDPEGAGHITFYVCDSMGYRPFQTPRDKVRVFPRGADDKRKVYVPFFNNGTFDKSFSETGITQNEDITILESPFECIQAYKQHVKIIRLKPPTTPRVLLRTPQKATPLPRIVIDRISSPSTRATPPQSFTQTPPLKGPPPTIPNPLPEIQTLPPNVVTEPPLELIFLAEMQTFPLKAISEAPLESTYFETNLIPEKTIIDTETPYFPEKSPILSPQKNDIGTDVPPIIGQLYGSPSDGFKRDTSVYDLSVPLL